MDIREHAQEPVAVGRSGGKVIDMNQIVPRAERDLAALLFDRTEAGEIDFPHGRIARQQGRHEGDRALGERLHDRVDPAPRRLVSLVNSGEAILRRTVADVLVMLSRDLPLAQQELPVGRRKLKWNRREIENVARLQLPTLLISRRRAGTIVFDGNPRHGRLRSSTRKFGEVGRWPPIGPRPHRESAVEFGEGG